MAVANSPQIFQQIINDLFQGFEYIHFYKDDHLILTKGDWTDHVHKLELTLNKINYSGLKYNIRRSFLRKIKMECLCSWITSNGVKLTDKKYKK